MVVTPNMTPSLVLSLFFFCYLLEDRAFEPVREVVVRLTISIVGSSCRDHDAVGYFKRKQKNPQAHGYRCSLHPGVFQSIDFPQRT